MKFNINYFKYDADVYKNSIRYKIPVNLIKAVIKTESDFIPTATRYEPHLDQSSIGLMQLLPTTAFMTNKTLVDKTELFQPDKNIETGVKYLANQYTRYKNWPEAIAAYNAGSARYTATGEIKNKEYVNKVMSYWKDFNDIDAVMILSGILGIFIAGYFIFR